MTSLVTTHAVYRWLTRVKGIARADMVALTDPLAPEYALAEAGCAILGLTLDQAKLHLAPPPAQAAIRAGCAKIVRDGYSMICGHGVVTTVILGRYGGPKTGWKAGTYNLKHQARRRERPRPDWYGEAAE